jgi:hypothetical protein
LHSIHEVIIGVVYHTTLYPNIIGIVVQFHLDSFKWSSLNHGAPALGPIPSPRSSSTASATEDSIYLFGGVQAGEKHQISDLFIGRNLKVLLVITFVLYVSWGHVRESCRLVSPRPRHAAVGGIGQSNSWPCPISYNIPVLDHCARVVLCVCMLSTSAR